MCISILSLHMPRAHDAVHATSIICHQYLKHFANRSAGNQQIQSMFGGWWCGKCTKIPLRWTMRGLTPGKSLPPSRTSYGTAFVTTWANWNRTVYFMRVRKNSSAEFSLMPCFVKSTIEIVSTNSHQKDSNQRFSPVDVSFEFVIFLSHRFGEWKIGCWKNLELYQILNVWFPKGFNFPFILKFQNVTNKFFYIYFPSYFICNNRINAFI